MNFRIQVRAEMLNKGKKILKRYPWQTANSLLKQFAQYIMLFMSHTTQTLNLIGGGTYDVNPTIGNQMRCDAAFADTGFGIQIGTGDTPVVMTDTQLVAQATTNIVHSVMVIALDNPSPSTWRMVLSRIITNNTGATLHIKEVGLACLYVYGPNNYILLDRSLYAVDVPDGVPITITYRITISL